MKKPSGNVQTNRTKTSPKRSLFKLIDITLRVFGPFLLIMLLCVLVMGLYGAYDKSSGFSSDYILGALGLVGIVLGIVFAPRLIGSAIGDAIAFLVIKIKKRKR